MPTNGIETADNGYGEDSANETVSVNGYEENRVNEKETNKDGYGEELANITASATETDQDSYGKSPTNVRTVNTHAMKLAI